MGDLGTVYIIWAPIQVALGIAWFVSLNAFQVVREEEASFQRWVKAGYFIWMWMPFSYVLIASDRVTFAEAIYWPVWSLAYAGWLLGFLYGFWRLVLAAVDKCRNARWWVGALWVWVMLIPMSAVLEGYVG